MSRSEEKGGACLEVLNEVVRVDSQLAIEDRLPSTLQQQQLIKRLKDVDAGLVNGAHNGSASVHNVAHSTHDNGCCSGIQTWICTQAITEPYCCAAFNGKAGHTCTNLSCILCMSMFYCSGRGSCFRVMPPLSEVCVAEQYLLNFLCHSSKCCNNVSVLSSNMSSAEAHANPL